MSLRSSRKGGQKYREKHKELGLCSKCNKKTRPGKVDCKKHAIHGEKNKERKWKYQKTSGGNK